ncbi:transmembrane protein 272 isoform X3 [Patella vulgata]|uniref:transmembrane protein 272 isoform X3 n=1 Tax=Patella vulgata TaxID=6465 RepID=UPI0024A8FC39|nr:transmembrane protein 272 isoform X3 [Patella vulgata]
METQHEQCDVSNVDLPPTYQQVLQNDINGPPKNDDDVSGPLCGDPKSEDDFPLPPTYQQVLQTSTEPPPSYETLFGKIKQAREESNGRVDFVRKVLDIFTIRRCITVLLAVMILIPISMVVIGVQHLSDCPVQRFIPMYLIVGGSFALFRIITRFCLPRGKKHSGDEEEEEEASCGKVCLSLHLIDFFLMAWFIAGNVWVYKLHGKFNSTDASSSSYCHPTVYYFTYWLLTSVYILMALIFICICGVFCVAAFALGP